MSMFDEVEDPATGQTITEISAYLRSSEVGAEVAIRDTQYGILKFSVARLTEAKPKLGKVITDVSGNQGGSSWYMTTGKSSVYPTGKSQLFKPTAAIRSYIEANPDGVMTHDIYTPTP